MVVSPSLEYIHSGGNRQPNAADWDVGRGILAFGADQNVALWRPLVRIDSLFSFRPVLC